MSEKRIPGRLVALHNWVCWGKAGADDKIPFQPNGRPAKANDPQTWHSFDECGEAVQAGKFQGVGLELGSGLVGIDLDHCIEDGQIAPAALRIVEQVGSYTEVSPSGRGLHILVEADFKGRGARGNVDGQPVEIYSSNRYFRMTGEALPGHDDIVENGAAVAALLQRMPATDKQPQGKVNPATHTEIFTSALIERMRASGQEFKFSALFDDGNPAEYGGDRSRADQALMNILAFWSCGNADVMKDIFMQSALGAELDRKKGHKDDYLQRTINRALTDCKEFCTYMAVKDWPRYCLGKDGEKKPIRAVYQNMEYLLQQLNISLKLNMLTKRIEVSRPDLQDLSFDSLLTEIRGLCHANGLMLTFGDTESLVKRIAEKYQYNPVHDYLKECRKNWDGGSYIHQLFKCFELDPEENQDPEFLEMLFTRWILSCVRLAFNKGEYGAQGVLILKGPQGLGKTRFLYTLLPVPSWGIDGLTLNPRNKDDVIKAISFWIAELGEFNETMRKERADLLKQFFSQRSDTLRPPYGHSQQTFPRTTAFLGTVNEQGILKDDTGERRYWVIAVKTVHNENAPNTAQMWGEAMHRSFDLKERDYLNQDEIQTLNKHNEAFKQITMEEQLLLDRLDWEAPVDAWQHTTATDLCDFLGLQKTHNGRMAKAIRRLGKRNEKVGIPTRHGDKKVYVVPPFYYDGSAENDFLG